MKKGFLIIALIYTVLFPCSCDTLNFEGDRIIGTWFLEKRIDTLDNSVKEFDVSEMKYKVTFFTNGKFEHIDEKGSINGEWRNKGNGLYTFSNDGGLLHWGDASIVEFIGDSAMSFSPPLWNSYIEYYVKLNE
ncbi:hypothetical protein [Aestuariivivens sediminis]|uniref:hypothetical protein n=1 Tax=Aestuariivivens sediminis TaxID=2913557 RepID=UPI001F576109|nr:hypothetical protein [Aestuariivivens sediminis]